MLKIDPKNVHDAIKPLVYFNCFTGLGVLRQPNQNYTTYCLMNFYTVIATLIQWMATYITLSSIEQIIRFDDTSPMAITMYKSLVCVNSGITVIAQLLIWLRRKAMKSFLTQMVALDETFEAVHDIRNEYKKEYIRLTCQFVAIFSILCSLSVYDTLISLNITPRMDIGVLLTFFSVAHTLHHPLLVMLLMDVNFRIFVGFLGKKFRGINDSLLRLAQKASIYYPGERLFMISQKVRPVGHGNRGKNAKATSEISDKLHLLREIRITHLELCQLSRKINRAFGTQNLLSMGISFVMVTGLLYTMYSAFSWRDFKSSLLSQVIPSAIWTGIYITKIWIINNPCWVVSNEAKRTGEVIYELLNTKVDDKVQREIQEFGLQILQNPVHFNARGFFTLDYTFVQGVIGSITTYLVILIQMSTLAQSNTSNTAVTVEQ